MIVGPWFKIRRFESLDSTNSEAIRRAKAGEPEGVVVVADTQTAGRGRLGRHWESPPGKNLSVTFLLRPPVGAKEALSITEQVAHVVKETLEKIPPHPPFTKGGRGDFSIKPPNDILLGGKKVAGILCEMGSTGDRTDWVVCGIGINVNAEPEDFSPEVRKTATSLKMGLGRELDREEILGRLIEMMDKWYAR